MTIVILCVLLVAAGIGYYGAGVHQKKKAAKEAAQEDKEITLYSLKADDLVSVHVVSDKADMTYTKENGVWKDAKDNQYPIDQEKINDILDDVAEVKASKLVVTDPEDISQYQLDKPSYQIELKDRAGTTKTLTIGMESVAAEGYYAYCGNKNKIYAIPSNITDSLSYTKQEMMELPEQPDINASYVTAFKVTPSKGETFEAVYNKNRAQYKDYEGWDITPVYGKTMPGSVSALQNQFSGLANLSCTDGVTYKATSSDKKKYGLDKPSYVVDVSYYTVEGDSTDQNSTTDESKQKKTDHVYQFSVGKKDKSGDNYYVSIHGEKGIYRMSAETIDGIVAVTPMNMLCNTPHKTNAGDHVDPKWKDA